MTPLNPWTNEMIDSAQLKEWEKWCCLKTKVHEEWKCERTSPPGRRVLVLWRKGGKEDESGAGIVNRSRQMVKGAGKGIAHTIREMQEEALEEDGRPGGGRTKKSRVVMMEVNSLEQKMVAADPALSQDCAPWMTGGDSNVGDRTHFADKEAK